MTPIPDFLGQISLVRRVKFGRTQEPDEKYL